MYSLSPGETRLVSADVTRARNENSENEAEAAGTKVYGRNEQKQLDSGKDPYAPTLNYRSDAQKAARPPRVERL